MEPVKAETNQQAASPELVSLQQRVTLLADSLEVLRAQLADQSKVLADLVARVGGVAVHDRPQGQIQAASVAAAAADQGLSPEILVVIAAAVTSFLGVKVRIRSAKMLQSPYEIINPWAQQGRVIVQASHYLRRS